MPTMSLRDWRIQKETLLTSEACNLEVDESIRIVCPFCNAEHEASLGLTRTSEGLLYRCFRAKCRAKGFISSIPGTRRIDLPKKKKAFTPRIFRHDLVALPESVHKLLFDKYGLTKEETNKQGFKYEPKYDRIFMPVFDARGEEFGCITKALRRQSGVPKSLTYFTRETPGIHYVRGATAGGKPVCVVEDILSAVKVSRFINTVALLGTTINNEKIVELRKVTQDLILMLDADACATALYYKKKYSFYFRNFLVIMLSKEDPKDMKEEELEALIRGAEADCSLHPEP